MKEEQIYICSTQCSFPGSPKSSKHSPMSNPHPGVRVWRRGLQGAGHYQNNETRAASTSQGGATHAQSRSKHRAAEVPLALNV